MISDNFVSAFVILLIFGAPIAAWVVSRVLAHQERIEMIRRGIVPPPGNFSGFGAKMPPPAWGPGPVPPPPPSANARGSYPTYDDYYYARKQMRKGVQITLIGFALLIGLGTIGSFGDHYFGPWLLGGLVPMFVGIAQIINAAMNGATIPGFGAGYGQGHAHFGPPPPSNPPPGGTPPPPPPSGPYAWRPGPTPEIEQRPDK
jgi:hypothetical protein